MTAPDPVGKLLANELNSREWSQADFAWILDRPTQFVCEIINGKKEITRESAAQIGAALGTTAEVWLGLQNRYLLAEQEKDVRLQAKLIEIRTRALVDRRVLAEMRRRRRVRAAS